MTNFVPQNPATALGVDVPWWTRPGLTFEGRTLRFCDRPVASLLEGGAPVMAYDLRHVEGQIRALRAAQTAAGGPSRLYYAIKANRFGPLVERVRQTRVCGIDACSPREVALALQHGFEPEEISFTGCALSHRDVDAVADLPIRINANSISVIHKLGSRAPGRAIGLRLNPMVGAAANERLLYAGGAPTKFGIYPDRVEEAVRLARSYGLRIEGVHMHVGSGWLADGLPTMERAAQQLAGLADALGDDLRYVNVGGGIGVVNAGHQTPVDLNAYARIVSRAIRSTLGDHIEVCMEPGDHIVNASCIVAATVTEVEEKGGKLFAGLDVGFNTNPQAAHYGWRHEVLAAERGPAGADAHEYVVTGNVNEMIDVFNPAAQLPELHEGDVVALLNCGGYGSSMASDHCLRTRPVERVIGA